MAKQTFTTGQVLTAAQMTSLQQTALGGGSTTAKTASYVLLAADAGTVVQMNSASATTITVNTALFAAGDTVQIQNVGAGVCTITAGTATVSTAGSLALSQYEGGQLYFNTTSAALFFDIVQSSGMTNPMTTTGDIIYSSSGSTPARLGIGSTSQVLTVASGVPSWATPAGGGKVLQVVMASTTNYTSNSTSTYADTGLSASITPSSASSKVLVLVNQNGVGKETNNTNAVIKLMRDSTDLAFISKIGYTGSNAINSGNAASLAYLDTPSTTSALTYKTRFLSVNNNSTAFVQDYDSGYSTMSTITLLEIGA